MPDLTFAVLKIFILGASSFILSFWLTPLLTHFLFKYKFWKKKARQKAIDGSEASITNKFYSKGGYKTPRSGGLLIWVSTLILSLLFLVLAKTGLPFFQKLNFLSRNQTWLPLFALIAGALLGLADDILTVVGLGKYVGGGLKLRHRLFLVFLIGLIGAIWFYFKLDWRTIHIPALGDFNIGAWYLLLFVLVNMAVYSGTVIDGLDGLSGGVFASIFGAYAVIALWRGQVDLASFCIVILGSLLSFLWFNIPPARFVMGETGMLGLSSALTVVAFLTDSVLVLPVIGFLLMLETGSDILQLFWKKFFKKKLFLAAPIHHHFQAKGWPHYKVTMRFWVISVAMAIIGVAVRLLG
jgi:phospho-N-acetylmuramoyl-pentapeptide-transferase